MKHEIYKGEAWEPKEWDREHDYMIGDIVIYSGKTLELSYTYNISMKITKVWRELE